MIPYKIIHSEGVKLSMSRSEVCSGGLLCTRSCQILPHYYYYYYYYYYYVSCRMPFLRCTSPLKTAPIPTPQASSFSIMCDVPSTVVFCSEYNECFPGMASNIFFKTYCYYSGGSSYHYLYNHTFHVPLSLLCFSFFSASFLLDISVHWHVHVYHYARCLFSVFNYCILPVCHNFSVCVHRLIP